MTLELTFVSLTTLCMSDHIHLKWLNKCVTSIASSPHAKNELHNSTHSLDKAGSLFRVYSSCFINAIVAHMRLPFFKIFSNFCPNFQIFCPFLSFSEKLHACPYVLHHKEYKSSFCTLFLIYICCKNIINFLFWVFWTWSVSSIKKIIPTCRNFDAYLHAEMNSIPNF